MISEITIKKVRELSIVDVIGHYTKLQRRGASYMGSCPFHEDKKPSFSVTPSKGLYHCFSCDCGGDALKLVQEKEKVDFMGAVEILAKRHNIPIEYSHSEKSEEELQAWKKRESLFIILEETQKFFLEQFKADAAAKQYAFSRWPEKTCTDLDIGYAPPKSQIFIDYCKRRCLSEEYLLELGLLRKDEKGNIYAFFRERITIPIRNLYGKIIGFTARYIGKKDGVQKYINSITSVLFKKGDVVFGINKARHCKDADYIIIVEGAPDVIRLNSIGMDNVVAALGTAWSDEQFAQLKRCTKSICFIPDSDPPNKDEVMGAGFNAVMTNGLTAMHKGFEVFVRELPFKRTPVSVPLFDFELEEAAEQKLKKKRNEAKKAGVPAKERREIELTDDELASIPRQKIIAFLYEKNDADEYIRSKKIFDRLEDIPFVVWYAEKKFQIVKSAVEERNAVSEIADLLRRMKDSISVNSCIEQLGKIYGKAKLWREALAKAKGEAKQQAATQEPKGESERERDIALLSQFNLSIKDNQYWSYEDDDGPTRLSNFILIPLYHIEDETNGTRIFRIVNRYNYSRVIALKEDELCSLAVFQKRIGSVGNFIWRAKIDKLNNVKEYTYAKTDSAKEIKILGWDIANGFFAFGNGVFIDGVFKPVDEMGIVKGVRNNTYYLPATSKMYANNPELYQFERRMVHENNSSIPLYDYVAKLVEVFGENARIAFCYLLATLFRDVVVRRTKHFPLLSLFGEKGTGKTSLATCLQAFFYHSVEPDQLGMTTLPSMNDLVSQAVNTLTVFDEYKNDLDPKLIGFLKGMWGGAGQTKKKLNAGGKATQTIVSTGIAICGQDKPTQDIALYTRLVFLEFTKPEYQYERQLRFDNLVALCNQGLTHLTLEVLGHRRLFEKNFPQAFGLVSTELSNQLKDEKMHARIFENWATMLATFRTLESAIDVPFSYAELFENSLRCMRAQNEFAKESSEVADFWEQLQGLQTEGKCIENAHYRIRYARSFKPLGADEEMIFPEPKPILYLNAAAVATLFNGGRAINSTANRSNWSTTTSYLKSHNAFLGLKQDRFIILSPNGRPEYQYDKNATGTTEGKIKVNRPKALCFDYSVLKADFHLNLETEAITEAEALSEDSKADAPPKAPSKPSSKTLFESDDEEELPF